MSPEPKLTRWSLAKQTIAELWHEVRHPAPLPVFYIPCGDCGETTAHLTYRKTTSLRLSVDRVSDVITTPPEWICEDCGHAQPRFVNDAVDGDTPVTCVGRRQRRIRSGRSRHPCAQVFLVPAATRRVICPWCLTWQPGPAHQG